MAIVSCKIVITKDFRTRLSYTCTYNFKSVSSSIKVHNPYVVSCPEVLVKDRQTGRQTHTHTENLITVTLCSVYMDEG